MRLPCLCDPLDQGIVPSLPALETSEPSALSLHLDPLTVSLTAIAGCVFLLALCLTQRQRLDAIERVSMFDPLTGLVCGRYFDAERWPARLRSVSPLAVLYIDLDGLKLNNDCFGHAAGDRYIVRAAEALRGCVRRGGDDVVRLHTGGDEFLIALYAPSRERAEKVAAQVLDRLRAVSISASIGVAFTASTDHGQRSALRKRAESAMYAAKRQGRGRIVVAAGPDSVPDEETKQPIESAAPDGQAVPEHIDDPADLRTATQTTRRYSIETAASLTAACGGLS